MMELTTAMTESISSSSDSGDGTNNGSDSGDDTNNGSDNEH